MIILLLLSINLFPSNSRDGVAYLVGAGGAEIGAQVVDLFLDDDMAFVGRETMRVFGGLLTSAVFHYALRKHFSTDREDAWVQCGRGHWIVARVSFDLIKHLARKKPAIAYMETIQCR